MQLQLSSDPPCFPVGASHRLTSESALHSPLPCVEMVPERDIWALIVQWYRQIRERPHLELMIEEAAELMSAAFSSIWDHSMI